MRRSALLLILSLAPLPAAAQCVKPEPPPVEGKPARPALPAKPACLDAKGGCPGWEAYSYNDAVKAYNLQLQAFQPLAQAYVQFHQGMIECESRPGRTVFRILLPLS